MWWWSRWWCGGGGCACGEVVVAKGRREAEDGEGGLWVVFSGGDESCEMRWTWLAVYL